jgi:hypothetical protein
VHVLRALQFDRHADAVEHPLHRQLGQARLQHARHVGAVAEDEAVRAEHAAIGQVRRCDASGRGVEPLDLGVDEAHVAGLRDRRGQRVEKLFRIDPAFALQEDRLQRTIARVG